MKRTGLKRIACTSCGLSAYQTVAQLERGDMPVSCWKCGGRFLPEDWEVLGHLYNLGLVDDEAYSSHPMAQAWQFEVERVAKGQAPHVAKQRVLKPAEAVAEDRVLKAFEADRRARQLAGLVQFSAAAQAAADMPF